MIPALRLSCWVAAIFFALSPLFMSVAKAPQLVRHLLNPESYTEHGRDLVFVSIAILAIGLIDAFETLIFVRNKRGLISKGIFFSSFLLIIIIFSQLFIYAYWSANIGLKLNHEEVAALTNLVVSAGSCALLARISLISIPGSA